MEKRGIILSTRINSDSMKFKSISSDLQLISRNLKSLDRFGILPFIMPHQFSVQKKGTESVKNLAKIFLTFWSNLHSQCGNPNLKHRTLSATECFSLHKIVKKKH